jgi:hypothetical protein
MAIGEELLKRENYYSYFRTTLLHYDPARHNPEAGAMPENHLNFFPFSCISMSVNMQQLCSEFTEFHYIWY